jgi:hypothetical protein
MNGSSRFVADESLPKRESISCQLTAIIAVMKRQLTRPVTRLSTNATRLVWPLRWNLRHRPRAARCVVATSITAQESFIWSLVTNQRPATNGPKRLISPFPSTWR